MLGVLTTYADGPKVVGRVLAEARDHGLPVVVDSGAWSVFSAGAVIDRDQHAAFVAERAPANPLARFIGLDVIGDTNATRANWLAQRQADAPVEPTVHRGGTADDVAFYTDSAGMATPWLNLGGMVGTPKAQHRNLAIWAARCIRTARDTDPSVLVHGLGATMPAINHLVPFTAIDSTYWLAPVRLHRSLPLFDTAPGDWRLLSTVTRGSGRATAWRLAHQHADFLRGQYAVTPAEVVEADEARMLGLSVESHARFARWLRARHGTDLVCYLAGAPRRMFPTIAHHNQESP